LPINVTVASIMACRLFRELKLGLLVDPISEELISEIMIRDIGTEPRQQSEHAFELHIFDDERAGVDIGTLKDFWEDEHSSDEEIELEGGRSRMRD
jgi:hypothetical protein